VSAAHGKLETLSNELRKYLGERERLAAAVTKVSTCLPPPPASLPPLLNQSHFRPLRPSVMRARPRPT